MSCKEKLVSYFINGQVVATGDNNNGCRLLQDLHSNLRGGAAVIGKVAFSSSSRTISDSFLTLVYSK